MDKKIEIGIFGETGADTCSSEPIDQQTQKIRKAFIKANRTINLRAARQHKILSLNQRRGLLGS